MVLTAGSGNWTLSAEEYSLFISRLMQGKIISATNVTTMLPQNDQSALGIVAELPAGMGMYGSQFDHNGLRYWNYNHAGGGNFGGPQGIWMTFFNGYTVVLLSNTAWGVSGTSPFQFLENSFRSALTP